MIKFRCTFNANTEDQCWRIASRKVKGRWVCLAHIDYENHPTDPHKQVIITPLKGSTSPDPEIRKKYNREYRRQYRIYNERKDKKGFLWPKELTLHLGYVTTFSLWRLGDKSKDFHTTNYHCERCCSQVEVVRIPYPPPKHRFKSYFATSIWYRGKHHRADATHECVEFPSTRLLNCERCGKLGTPHTIKGNRILSGPYSHKLCLSCYRVMRPLWAMYEERIKLADALKKLKYEMRKVGMHPTAKPLDRYWLIKINDYDATWWIKTHKEV